jgi:hypothetical protein
MKNKRNIKIGDVIAQEQWKIPLHPDMKLNSMESC